MFKAPLHLPRGGEKGYLSKRQAILNFQFSILNFQFIQLVVE